MAIYLRLCLSEFVTLYIAAEEEDFRSIVHSAILLLTNVDDVLHARELLALEVTALACPELRKHCVDHVHIVIASAVSVHDTESVHIRVLAEILQFGLLVVCIYSDCNCTDLGTGVKECKPIRNITCPDTHMGTLLDTYGKETLGHIVHTFVEFAPGKAEITVRIYDILLIRSRLGPVFQPVAESSVKQFIYHGEVC